MDDKLGMSVTPFTALMLFSLILSLILSRALARLIRSPRLLGADVHKPDRPLVPKVGGVAFTVSYSAAMLLNLMIEWSVFSLVLIVSPLIAALLGLLEDVEELNPIIKPILLLLPGVPVLLFAAYNPYPVIPFIGGVRITLLYPLLVLAAYTVVANAVNSVDVLNGSLVLSSLPVLLLLAGLSLLKGSVTPALACLILSASLIGFLKYNWFPAKIFSGNVGSNTVAAVITTVAITARLEVIALIALLPHILNEFLIIVSMGGLKSGKSLASRPIRVVSGMIVSSFRPGDPLTLVRLIASEGPLSESSITKRIALISLYSSTLALLTYLFAEVAASWAP